MSRMQPIRRWKLPGCDLRIPYAYDELPLRLLAHFVTNT